MTELTLEQKTFYTAAFSPDYSTARSRFREAALRLKCHLEAHSIEQVAPNGEDLTIDVAILGASEPQKIVVVSSGLHGVEGFFGSAVQIALLEDCLTTWSLPPD